MLLAAAAIRVAHHPVLPVRSQNFVQRSMQNSRRLNSLSLFFTLVVAPRGVLKNFSVRGRAAEQGIIFRIPTPGQGVMSVKVGTMTGSIFVMFDFERSCYRRTQAKILQYQAKCLSTTLNSGQKRISPLLSIYLVRSTVSLFIATCLHHSRF